MIAPPAPAQTPQIARTGTLSLYVQNVDRAISDLSRAARTNGGDVFSSNVENGDSS